jgi:hypothetical protein
MVTIFRVVPSAKRPACLFGIKRDLTLSSPTTSAMAGRKELEELFQGIKSLEKGTQQISR